jgi:hypothetical protein
MEYDDNNLEAFNSIVKALKGLDADIQKRTLQAVVTFLNISFPIAENGIKVQEFKNSGVSNSYQSETSFSVNRDISPKDFIRDKLPRTDVERVACLAYYLTHYRSLQYFKTLEISALNTEAAQPKLSNAAYTVDNAAKAGLLVQGERGSKQLSAAGEIFVQALPDRDAAKAALANMRIKRRAKRNSKGSTTDK